MSGWAALASLGAICALSGCFEVNYGNCRVTCTHELGCPAGLMCVVENDAGLCAPPGTNTCNPGAHVDAAPDRIDAREAGPDARDAGPDAEAGTAGPPSMLCHNGSCLTLPDSIRKNLVLLLWPSNLPPVGSPVSVWKDQSGQGNDAHALYLAAAPEVIPDGVQLDQNQLGSGFVVANSPSLDFGSGDFAIIVVAGLPANPTPITFLRKSDGARTGMRRISIDWALVSSAGGQPEGAVDDTVLLADASVARVPVAAYTLLRATDHIELHLDGAVIRSADLPTPGASTTNAADVYVGAASALAPPTDTVEAVVAIRGAAGSSDIAGLESFFRSVFAAAP